MSEPTDKTPSDKQPPPFDIDDEFDNFMRRCYPKVQATSIQYRETRRSFFGGMSACYFYVLSLARYDADIGEKELQKLQDQLVEYFKVRMDKEV